MGNNKERIRNFIKLVLGLARCPICGDVETGMICGECERELREDFLKRRKGRLCRYCGLPLISEKEICCDCRAETESDRTLFFPEGTALFAYKGIGKEAVRVFKFKNERSFGIVFASFASVLLENRRSSAVLVPVPGNRSNVRSRGWDPAAVIADALKEKGFRTAVLLERKRVTVSLKRLNREERLRRAADCYRLRKGAEVPSHVILIDDVRTTGSTVNRCARLLKEAGAEEVSFLVLAAA
ncbi:MAG: phosphoribosyltransferase family protein [Spirochaetia bacterium]|nr:phosphoribosyltransferase family protein [Spirochaetia bacterium]